MPGEPSVVVSRQRFPPDDPREWLNRAKAALAPDAPEIYREDLCFDAQQAAEKALKAVLLHLHGRFPYTHDLAQLLSLVKQAGQEIPAEIEAASSLTEYAVEARYPGFSESVTWEEYQEAVTMARSVVRWAEETIRRGSRSRFKQAMAKVADVEPEAYDRL